MLPHHYRDDRKQRIFPFRLGCSLPMPAVKLQIGQVRCGTSQWVTLAGGGMSLQFWDPQRHRWILYRTQEQHSADCAQYPLDDIPRRVFLDTNVVNLMVKQRLHVFEQEPLPDTLERQAALDAEALMHVCSHGGRGSWTMMASRKTIEEIEKTTDAGVRGDLLDYAFEIVDHCSEDWRHASDLGRRLAESSLLEALPDRSDRELIGHAIGFGCDAFCTRDHKTIVRKREALPKLPIRIVTPREWWQHIKPWASLLA